MPRWMLPLRVLPLLALLAALAGSASARRGLGPLLAGVVSVAVAAVALRPTDGRSVVR
jgi:hypothetical protein